ncbi:uncharacterized protein LOC125946646 [Dermacentor silvarum]|uniref:uncharacterized protein LOC125946646 n=1 Tax=Dermacentor silvarum TaxID=543639 RepID=UPI002100DE5D|nr:uncharacterized protein LOC125946646 [Dermacentor silvarum]
MACRLRKFITAHLRAPAEPFVSASKRRARQLRLRSSNASLMAATQSVFTAAPLAALALATCLSWQHAAPADGAATNASRVVTKLKEEYFNKYAGLVSLGIVHGSAQNAYFDVLRRIESITTYFGNDAVVWATSVVSESNCSTTTPFALETCVANNSKPSRACVMAIYIGPLGVHLSTQYYQCTDS